MFFSRSKPHKYLSKSLFRVSRYNILSLSIGLSLLSVTTQATVTYDGTDGVNAQVFATSCNSCHSGDGVYNYTNWDEYADASAQSSLIVDRMNGVGGVMPASGALSGTLISLVTSWDSGSAPQNAAPTVTTTAATSVGKNSATLNATVNDNGVEASYDFDWGIGDYANTNSGSDNDSSSGGGTATDTATVSLSSLVCNTNYQFRAEGTNTTGTTVSGTTLNFSTTACNEVPALTAIGTQSATEDSAFGYNTAITDQDGGLSDSLTYDLTVSPAGMSINASGVISWTPTSETSTSESVTVRVTDADADAGYTTSTQSFTVNITLVNDQPALSALSNVSVDELATLAVSAGSNLTDPDDLNDGSGAITWSLSGEPSGMTISNTGTISWVPGITTAGVYNVTVQVQDGLEDSSTQQSQNIQVTVNSVNAVPLIDTINTQSATEDQAFAYSVAVTDRDGGLSDSLTYTITSGLTNSEINSATGQINWTPTSETQTSVNVTVQVDDADAVGGYTTDTESFTLNITLVNEQPVFNVLSSANVAELSTLTINAGNNLTDPDDANNGSGAINWSLSGQPSGMSISNTGTISWTPGVGTAGVYNLTVQVQDGLEDGSVQQSQSLTVTVGLVNTVPLIDAIATQSATEDQAFNLNVTVTDRDDTLSDSLTYSITNGLPSDTINSATGEINWTPTSETETSVSVTVQVVDADAINGFTTDSRVFTININLVDEPPVFSAAPAVSNNVTEDNEFSFDFEAADPESTVLFYSFTATPDLSATTQPISLDSSTGVITWTPDGSVSTVNITVTASDGNNDNNISHAFAIKVAGTNDTPILAAIATQALNEEGLLSVTASATDLDGDILVYSLVSAPSDMTINSSSGLINWSVDEVAPGTTLTQSVTVAVTDNFITTPVTTSFDINVSPVNDQPSLSALASQSATTTLAFQFNAANSFSDPDDNNDGSGQVTWSLSGEPSGMTISNIGLINWTPTSGTAGQYTIAVMVEDGKENGSQTQSRDLVVNVALLDSDGDGIGDEAELANGLDPNDPNDAALDSDGDGISNLDEYNQCLTNDDFLCNDLSVDSVAPEITVEDLTVDATGYLTTVSYNATALDGNDGEITPTADINIEAALRPGHYTIIWTAIDSSGNSSTAEQNVDVLPLASLGGSIVLSEGNSAQIPFKLNGLAPYYPVTFEYQISGEADSSDHNLTSGSIELTSGQEINLSLLVTEDQLAESDETVLITLTSTSDNVVLTEDVTYTVQITESAVAPSFNLEISQQDVSSVYIYKDSGIVTVTTNATDANGDELSYDWSSSSAEITPEADPDAIDGQITFDPGLASLTNGSYQIVVMVSDGVFQISQSVTIVIADTAPVLLAGVDSDNDGIDDIDEGYGDSDGDKVPDYLDSVDEPNLLQVGTPGDEDSEPRLLSTQAGLSLTLGDIAVVAENAGAKVSSEDITDENGDVVTDGDKTIVGGLYDFEVHGLTTINPVATIVIPLDQALPTNAVYRKFINGSWTDFAVTNDDMIRSARSVDNACPLAGNESYQDGLITLADCVELTIRDGGPNDTDGEVNGIIKDPSGPSIDKTFAEAEAEEIPTTSSQGAGFIQLYLLAFLSLLLFVKRKGQ